MKPSQHFEKPVSDIHLGWLIGLVLASMTFVAATTLWLMWTL